MPVVNSLRDLKPREKDKIKDNKFMIINNGMVWFCHPSMFPNEEIIEESFLSSPDILHMVYPELSFIKELVRETSGGEHIRVSLEDSAGCAMFYDGRWM